MQYLSIIRVCNHATTSLIRECQDKWQRSCTIRSWWGICANNWCMWRLPLDIHHHTRCIIILLLLLCSYSFPQLHRWILRDIGRTQGSGTLSRLWWRTREYTTVVWVLKTLVWKTCKSKQWNIITLALQLHPAATVVSIYHYLCPDFCIWPGLA